MPAINYRELKRQTELDGGRVVANHLRECLEDGTFRPDEFSLRQLFESTVEDGRAYLDSIDERRKGGRHWSADLRESGDVVDTGTFANITGQIVFSKIKEGYDSPDFLWPQLVDQQQTNFPYGERIPGVGEIGDKMADVGEGEEYPTAGLNEEYLDVPATKKKGVIVNVTREAVVYDRTAQVLKKAGNQAYSFGLQLEKKVLRTVTGQTGYNNYKRNGVATNTYLTSGAYINSTSSTLTDWTSIQTLELLFDAMTDPNTGEPIVLQSASLLVPSALKRTANRILMASQVAQVDNQANASTVRTFAPNPMNKGFYGQPAYNVLSNAFVKVATSSASTWFFGDFKKAFCRMYAWDMEIEQAADNNQMKFERDIWHRFKVSSRDVIAVLEPRYVATGT